MGLISKSRRAIIPAEEFGINITSLLDIMTILLFFLIKSFTTTTNALTPPDNVRIPLSAVVNEPNEALTVSISATEIRAGDVQIASLVNGRFTKSDLQKDGLTLLPLKKYLEEARKAQITAMTAEESAQMAFQGKILIQADKEIPFSLLKAILHTASISGYLDYQFVVANPASG